MNDNGYTTNWGRGLLYGLQTKKMYGGEVSHDEKAKRRKANLVAKASRKANRGKGHGRG